jgi:hypothetical protein
MGLKNSPLQCLVTPELRADIDRRAKAEQISTSAFIRRTLADAVRKATARPPRAHAEELLMARVPDPGWYARRSAPDGGYAGTGATREELMDGIVADRARERTPWLDGVTPGWRTDAPSGPQGHAPSSVPPSGKDIDAVTHELAAVTDRIGRSVEALKSSQAQDFWTSGSSDAKHAASAQPEPAEPADMPSPHGLMNYLRSTDDVHGLISHFRRLHNV